MPSPVHDSMEKRGSMGVNNDPLHRRTRTFTWTQVTQTLPMDSQSNDPDLFTQLIDHDSVANICGGDTMVNDTDNGESAERSGDTEVLPHDDDDAACGNDVQSALRHDDILDLEKNNDLSLKGKNEIFLSKKHGLLNVHRSLKDHGGPNLAKLYETDLFKYESDATMEEEEEEEEVDSEYDHKKDEDRKNSVTASIETVIKPRFKSKEDIIPNNGEPHQSKLHKEDNHALLNSTPKPGLVLGSSSGKDSPVTLYASSSRPKSIASVRAASLRASGLRAAMGNARAVSLSKGDTPSLKRPDQGNDTKDFVGTSHKQPFEFIGTEILHDTSQACYVSSAQTPPKIRMELDSAKICSPRMSTTRPKLSRKSTQMNQLKAQSRQKARKLVFDSEEEFTYHSDYRSENSDKKLGSISFQVHQKKPLNLTPLESGLNTPTSLTYLESQEPGEESQMNALNVVDKLIWLDVTCTPQEAVKSDESIFPPGEGHLGTSGLKSFAQAAQMKAVHEKMDVFDWIDSQADEESPLPGRDMSDKDNEHTKQLGDSKLIASMKKQPISHKSKQNGNDDKIAELNTQADSAISDAAVVQSSAITPALLREMEHSRTDQGVKMRALLTTRLKNRRLESPACKLNVASYCKRKAGPRKNRRGNSDILLARSLQKQKSDVIEVKEVINIIPTENVRAKESELGCVIQTAIEAGLETDLSTPVVKTSKRRNFLNGNTTRNLRKKKNIQPARTIKLRCRKMCSEGRNVDSVEDLRKEEGKIENMMKMGPKTRSNAPDAHSKLHDKRDKTTTMKHNSEIPSLMNNKEKTPSIDGNRKRKAVSEFALEAVKQKTERDTSVPRSKIHLVNKLTILGTDVLSSCKSRNDMIDKLAMQKPTCCRQKKATDALGSEKAYEGQNDRPNTRGNQAIPISENVSNLLLLDEGRRRKRNPSCIRVLFSHSLPEEITKYQKKILAKLGGSIATSASSCTHFISNSFVRTRNMLVSMASGKVVATPRWLESCNQAHYFVDEKNYILQDEKKERELGFSMHSSLAAARRKPLLKGLVIVVTPNTIPDPEAMKEIIETAGGQIVQNTSDVLHLDASQGGKLVIADVKDYEYCLPFLEKGFRVYSTELILHGIVTQNLDFSRNQILPRRNTRMSGKTNVK